MKEEELCRAPCKPGQETLEETIKIQGRFWDIQGSFIISVSRDIQGSFIISVYRDIQRLLIIYVPAMLYI